MRLSSSMFALPPSFPMSPSASINPGRPYAVIIALIKPVLITSNPPMSEFGGVFSTVTPGSSGPLGPVTAML